METVEIKEGPKLDRAVAEAIGDPLVRPYSRDLNAVFAAAEKAKLFQRRSLRKFLGRWMLTDDSEKSYQPDVLAEADTPALAICAAILKLNA